MFAYLEGIVSQIKDNFLVLDVKGIGFYLYIPPSLCKKLTVGKTYRIFTSFLLNNEVPALFGFLSEKDKELFELLISISGIGPKCGLALISELGYDGVVRGIKNEEIDTLGGVPGVGKKKARKLILELKEKLAEIGESSQENMRLLTETLKKLGYNKKDIREAIEGIDMENNSLEDLIKISLKRLYRKDG